MNFKTGDLLLSETDFSKIIRNQKGLVIILCSAEDNACSFLLESSLRELQREIAQQISWYIINLETVKTFAETYSVKDIPTLLYFNNGRLIDVSAGLLSKNELILKIQKNLGQ